MTKLEEGQAKIEALKTARPDISITVHRRQDPSFEWDGNGPDPADDGFIAYDVWVTAMTIRNGVRIEGNAYLGGSYYRPDEPIGEINGYLPQMVDEAVADLDAKLA